MTKKILSLVLSVIMVLSFIPLMAFAEGETPYTTGLNDNASYLMKVPSQSEDYTIVTEDGENFIKPTSINADGFKDVTISASEFMFGTETGLPSDYPLSDDADLSKLWVALRIKIKDNNPAYSNLNASVRMYFDRNNLTFNNNLGSKATHPCRWLDLNDGSMTWAYPWSASYISSSNTAEFEFTGDMDGYLLVPLKNVFTSLSSVKQFDGFSFRFYNGSTASGKTIKKSSWSNKEFLIGDCFLVTEGETQYDLSAFQNAHTQGIEKYAPNNYEDTAYYSLRVGGYRTLFFNAFAQSVSKNWYDTTAVRSSTGPVAHITTLSNGDRAFEITVNEGMDYSTPIDIPAADTYDHYKGYKTNMKDLSDQVGKGVPDEIDLTNLRTLAFRVATKDGSVENETIKFSYGVGTSATPYRLSANAVVKYVDINKKTVVNLTADADGNLTVNGNLDGYIIIPIDSFSSELTPEAIKEGWNYHSYTSNSMTGGDKSSNELYLVSGFDNGKAFYYGDVYFVENVDTFLEYHEISLCQHETTKKEGEIAADCENEGHTGKTICVDCETVLDEGSVIDALGHKEIAGEGKESTCTEKGYESSVVCGRCGELLEKVNEIPEIPHKYEGEGKVVAPTEDKSGYTEYTCDYGCGTVKKINYVMPLSSEVKNVKAEQIVKTMDLRVSWDAIEGADMYLVYVYDADGKQIRGATVTNGNTTVRIDGFKIGNYTVKVRARVGGKYTSKYDAVEFAMGSILPTAPVARVLKTDKESITVTWDAVEGAEKYFVEFVGGGERFAPSATENYLVFDKLKVNTEYKISVCVKLSDTVYIPFGEQITAKTENHADINLGATYEDDKILVSWDVLNEIDNSADKYWVYRVGDDGKWDLFAATYETSVYAQNIEGRNTFGIVARVKDKYGIYRYIKSQTAEVRDASLLTYTPVDTTGMTDLQKAVVLTAENYVLHANRIQYEDTRINNTKSRNQYRWGYIKTNTLESYTTQNIKYSNCAAWTHENYWNALDYDITQYQTAQWCDLKPSEDSRILLKKSKADGAFDTQEKCDNLEKQIRKLLEPGDLVVFTRDSGTGHIMMYVGNNMMIHCTGSSFNWTDGVEKYETSGAVRYESSEVWFTPDDSTYSRYLFNKQTFAIVRPLKTYEGGIPEKTLDRMTTMRGVVSEKLASVDTNVTVNPGDEITFTIRFSNYSAEDKTINVTDIVPANTTYVSGAQNKDGDNLSWTVNVPAGRVAEVCYTVRVNDDAMGKTIYGTDTMAESLNLLCHKIYVKKTLTETEQQSILEAVETLKDSELTDIALADAIYKEALSSAVLENATSVDVLNGVFKNYAGTSSWPSRWQQKETVSNTFLKMLAPNMYGGRQVIDPDGKVNSGQGIERTRLVIEDNLVIGDIIVANKPETEIYTTTEYTFQPTTVYMYLGDGFLDLTTGEKVTYNLENIMITRHFCVIRPSIEM